jgi:seryl-tRNA synthetase
MNLNFRSSLHGFNRQDVANYLEYLNNRHAAQVNQLNTDLEALRRQAEAPAEDPQRTALEARCRELEQQLEAVRKERDEALAQREAAEQKLASARQEREEALLRSCGEKLEANRELEAYRRAERTERMARERAEQVYSETGTVLTQASNRIEAALRQMTGISQQVTGQLDTLQTAIASSRLALQDAAQTIDKLKPSR